MDRSLYNDGVEIRQPDLTNTETQRAFHILRRFLDTTQMGVASGLEVTPGGVAGTISIAVGRGYAPNGELADLLAALLNQELSDSTNNTVNLVGLMYTEQAASPGAHETNGTAPNRRAERAANYRSYTLTEFASLPATSEDLTVDAQDRYLICGVVTAQGPSIAITANDIVTPDLSTLRLAIDQPGTLTGIRILSISSNTLPSDPFPVAGAVSPARLDYDPATGLLSYTAPHDAGGAGAGVDITVAATGDYTLNSDDTSFTCTVRVTRELLPQSGNTILATIFNTMTVSVLYDPPSNSATPLSANDLVHRSAQGTAIAPSTANPHGTSDLGASGVMSLLSQLVLGTNLRNSTFGMLAARLLVHHASSIGSRTLVLELPTDDATLASVIRLYRYHAASVGEAVEVTLNARWSDNGTTRVWNKEVDANESFRVRAFLSSSGSPDGRIEVHYRDVGAGTWDDASWTRQSIQLGLASELTSMFGRMVVGTGLLGTIANRALARFSATFSVITGARTLLFSSPPSTGTQGPRIYMAEGSIASAQAYPLEIVQNASYDETSTLWTKDIGASLASKVEIGTDFVAIYRRAGVGSWPDGSWAQVATFDMATSDLTVGNDLFAGRDVSASRNVIAGQDITATGIITGDDVVGISSVSGAAISGATITASAASVAPYFEPNTNAPAPGSYPTAARIYDDTIIRAWALFAHDGAGAVTIDFRVGISGAVIIGGTGIQFTFAQPFNDPNEYIVLSLHNTTGTGTPGGSSGKTPNPVAADKTTTSFIMRMEDDGNTPVTPTGNPAQFGFIVLGRLP